MADKPLDTLMKLEYSGLYMDAMKCIGFIDGGSRGNPGYSASAFALSAGNNHVITKARHIGFSTNNEAEYRALLSLLSFLTLWGDLRGTLDVLSDSKLVVNQMTGRWKIKDPRILAFKEEAQCYIDALGPRLMISLHYFPRSFNTEADKAVNVCLDKGAGPTSLSHWGCPLTCSKEDWAERHLDPLRYTVTSADILKAFN